MTKTTSEAMAGLDVLSVALQETVRALSPAKAAQVEAAILMRVADLTAAPITPAADEALTGELAPLLTALGSSPQLNGAATRLC